MKYVKDKVCTSSSVGLVRRVVVKLYTGEGVGKGDVYVFDVMLLTTG